MACLVKGYGLSSCGSGGSNSLVVKGKALPSMPQPHSVSRVVGWSEVIASMPSASHVQRAKILVAFDRLLRGESIVMVFPAKNPHNKP